ncbi:hypothetical protein HMPREF1548_02227 [Clostridium sp. KLE 1755]|nr:hypothetical protein HMPREF1548_02227 [Clostridium sp. KLE 1755]
MVSAANALTCLNDNFIFLANSHLLKCLMVKTIWYTVICVHRRKSGAEFRRRPVSAKRIWYNIGVTGFLPVHTVFCVHRRKPGARFRLHAPAPGQPENG